MEDKILTEYVKLHGEGKWRNLPKRAGLKRCGKSCRLRWLNYLRPDIKRGNITRDEEELIIRLHKLLGNRWSLIAGRLPGRTDNEIKNYWNTNIGKKVQDHLSHTSKRSNQVPTQEKQNHSVERLARGPAEAKIGSSCVVRTKATKCTKAVNIITSEQPIKLDQHNQIIETKPVVEVEVEVQSSMVHHHDPVDFSQFMLGENNPSNFMMDFEMEENFISDLLNLDFSQLPCFENGGDSSSNTCDKGHSSPISDHTHLVSRDTLHGSNFQSVGSLIESELDWLCD